MLNFLHNQQLWWLWQISGMGQSARVLQRLGQWVATLRPVIRLAVSMCGAGAHPGYVAWQNRLISARPDGLIRPFQPRTTWPSKPFRRSLNILSPSDLSSFVIPMVKLSTGVFDTSTDCTYPQHFKTVTTSDLLILSPRTVIQKYYEVMASILAPLSPSFFLDRSLGLDLD